jgi:hypothetical protein
LSEPCGVAGERRRQVLDEVHLVHVPARDRLPHRFDRVPVPVRRPRRLPGSDLDLLVALSHKVTSMVAAFSNAARHERELGTRLGRRRRRRSTDRLREAVAEVEVGHELLATGLEEPAVAEPRLDPPKRAVRLQQLERLAVRSPHRGNGGSG